MPIWCYVPIPVEIAFLQVFVPPGKHSKGHSLLFLLSKPSVMDRTDTYLYMSICNGSVALFRTNEQIVRYISELSSDLVYAIGIGDSNVYFMMVFEYLPKDMFHNTHNVHDAYGVYFTLEKKGKRFMYIDVLCSEYERFSVERLMNLKTPKGELH